MRIHIENIYIHAGQAKPQSTLMDGLLLALGNSLEQRDNKPSATSEPLNKPIPNIGEQWPGLDAKYGGITRGENGKPDAHLILWNAKPKNDLNYKDGANWAKDIHPETNSHIASKVESALLYANLRDEFDHDQWYFTSTQSSTGYVYGQDFTFGSQGGSSLSSERRVRAVSRLPL